MNIITDKKYPNMYRVEWPDGVQSADMYNLTWAKEHKNLIPEQERESKLPIARRMAAQRPHLARGCV